MLFISFFLLPILAPGGHFVNSIPVQKTTPQQLAPKPTEPPNFQTPTPPLPAKTIDTGDPGAITIPPPSKIDPLLTKPISAEVAAKIAILRQPSLRAAKASVTAARGLVIQARSGLYPTTTLSSSYNYSTYLFGLGAQGGATGNNAVGGQSQSGYSNVVQLKQLIFDFGKTLDSVHQAEETKKATMELVEKSKNDLIFAVEQQYFSTVEAKQQIEEDIANLASNKAQLNLAQGTLKAGFGAPSDVVNASANYDNSIQTLVQARNAFLQDRINLAALIGVDPRTPIQVIESPTQIKSIPIDLNRMVQLALKSRPEIKAAQDSLKASKFGISEAKRGLAPNVDLNLSAATRGSNDPFASDTTSAGVSLNWPIEDGNLTQGKVEQANGLAAESEANLASAQISTISDVTQAYANLESSVKRYASAEAGVSNATEALNLAEGRYKSGVALFTEVTIAQAALVTAQTNELSTRTSYEIAIAQFNHAVGVPFQISSPK